MSFFLRSILIIFSFFIPSCSTQFRDQNSAKLSFFNSVNKKTFSFIISEEFVNKNKGSKSSDLYPKMSVAELKLLTHFLQDNKYCINKNGELSFKINSKQEKIYDVTFSNLIEQSYNARPIAPATYFGECL